eukprot:scaffold106182_cov35-Tisochrysis_lutea.AAC.1
MSGECRESGAAAGGRAQRVGEGAQVREAGWPVRSSCFPLPGRAPARPRSASSSAAWPHHRSSAAVSRNPLSPPSVIALWSGAATVHCVPPDARAPFGVLASGWPFCPDTTARAGTVRAWDARCTRTTATARPPAMGRSRGSGVRGSRL